MKKFKFSLERIHNYKEQILNKEKNELTALNQRKNEMLEEIDRLNRYIASVNLEISQKQKTGIKVFEMATYNFTKDNAKVQIDHIRIDIEKLDIEIEKQTQIVVEASIEVKGLDKLYEKQKKEYDANLAKIEEETIAELLTIKAFRSE